MNQQLLFSVHDQKAETFMPPFFVPAKGLAIRAFEDCVNSDSHHFGKHPADYTLFFLGTFNTDTAKFDLKAKQSVGNGVEFVNPLKSEPIANENPSRSNNEDS